MASDELHSKFVFEAGQALQALRQVSTEFQSAAKAVQKLGSASNKTNPELQAAKDQITKLARAEKEATRSVERLITANIKLTASLKRQTASTKAATSANKNFAISWQAVKRIFVGQIIFRALSAVTTELQSSVGEAVELGVALAEIQTISTEFRANFDGLASSIRSLSESFGVAQIEIARGTYQTLSNQIAQGEDAIRFMADAMLFAKATVTTADQAVNLLSGTLNAMGLNISNTTRIMDIFFKGIELGRFKAEDLANSIGRVLPLARQLGISTAEVITSIAVLTRQGMTPERAQTGILNLMLRMIKPSEELTKAMKSLGLSSIRAGVQMNGMLGFLQKIEGTTDGSAEAIGRLFPRVRAMTSHMGLLVDEGKFYTETFNEITNVTEGTAAAMGEFVKATDAEQFKRNVIAIKNTFIEEFGKPVIELFNDLVDAFGGAKKALTGLAFVVKAVAAGAFIYLGGTAIAASVNALIAFNATTTVSIFSLQALRIAMLAVPFLGWAAAAGIAVAAAWTWANSLKEARMGLTTLEEEMDSNIKKAKERGKELADIDKDINQQIIISAKAASQIMQEMILNRVSAQKAASIEIMQAEETITKHLERQASARVKILEKIAEASLTAVEKAQKKAAKIDKKIADLKLENEQIQFDWFWELANKKDQRQAQSNRAEQLRQRARKAGTLAEQEALLDLADANASRASNEQQLIVNNKTRISLLRNERNNALEIAKTFERYAPAFLAATERAREFLAVLKEQAKVVRESKLPIERREARVGAVRTAVALHNEYTRASKLAAKFGGEAGKKYALRLAREFDNLNLPEKLKEAFSAGEAMDMKSLLPPDLSEAIKIATGRNVESFKELQDVISKTNDKLKRTAENTISVSQQMEESSEATKNLAKSLGSAGGLTAQMEELIDTLHGAAQIEFIENLLPGEDSTKIKDTFNDIKTTYEEFKVALERGVQTGQFENASEAFATLKKRIDNLKAKDIDVKQLSDALDLVDKKLKEAKKEAGEVVEAKKAEIDLQRMQLIVDKFFEMIQAATGVETKMEDIGTSFGELKGGGAVEDIGSIDLIISDVGDTAGETKTEIDNLATALGDVSEGTQGVVQATQTIAQNTRAMSEAARLSAQSFWEIGTASINSANVSINANQAIGNSLNQLGPIAIQTAQEVVSALNAIGPSARNQIGSIDALAAAFRRLDAAKAVVGMYMGGVVPQYKADGGPIMARGTDVVSTHLSPGEYVTNSASSRRFYPELRAINAGVSPVARNNAQVTNNSFSGDININVPAGVPVDGRTVAKDIRRELRRRTSTLD